MCSWVRTTGAALAVALADVLVLMPSLHEGFFLEPLTAVTSPPDSISSIRPCKLISHDGLIWRG